MNARTRPHRRWVVACATVWTAVSIPPPVLASVDDAGHLSAIRRAAQARLERLSTGILTLRVVADEYVRDSTGRVKPAGTTARPIIAGRRVHSESIRFDRRRQRMLVESTAPSRSVEAWRALFVDGLRTNYSRSRYHYDSGDEVSQSGGIDRMPWPVHSPYSELVGDNSLQDPASTTGMQTIRCSRDRSTGLEVVSLAGREADARIWLDAARGGVLVRREWLSKKTGQVFDDTRVAYARHRQGIWYPTRITTTTYDRTGSGTPRAVRRITVTVTRANLNAPLSPSTFALKFPVGTQIWDSRTQPPQERWVRTDGTQGPREVAPARPAPIAVGALAPDFALPDLGGSTQTLSAWRGKVVVLNLFAFW